MKRLVFLTIAIALACGSVSAQNKVDGVSVDSLRMVRNGEYLTVDMAFDLSRLNVDGNRAVLLTPRLVNGKDSLNLPAVGIYGRRRYYTYVRNGESMLSGGDEQSFRASRTPKRLPYRTNVNYAAWMDGAKLILDRGEYGCCNTLLAEQRTQLDEFHAPKVVELIYEPHFVYARPVAEKVKSRSLSGRAYIDFPVNRTEIHPDYRNNSAELAKIVATIDSVRNDGDVTITSLSIKGYASPEGPYANNRRLAEGRTMALKEYVQRQYAFSHTFIATSFEPEDWAGLREYVAASNLPHKAEIIALIDGDREPDNKEWKLKSTYVDEYKYLFAECYPALRHSDYRVEYVVRGFSDVEEIKRVMHSRPQKLSLQEFYLVAQTLEPGSAEFNEVFDIAARMFPDDATANLNAANSAMSEGDMRSARYYLGKAGESAEADYARGVYAAMTKNYASAQAAFRRASDGGVGEATAALEVIDKLLEQSVNAKTLY